MKMFARAGVSAAVLLLAVSALSNGDGTRSEVAPVGGFALVSGSSADIEHVHSSSLYSTSASAFASDVAGFRAAGADLLTFTEVGNKRRAKSLNTVAADGAAWQGVWGESGISWSTDRFRLETSSSAVVSRKKWAASTKKKRTPNAEFVVLSDQVTGKRILVTTLHLPAGVENCAGTGWEKRTPYRARVKAHKHAMKGWVAGTNAVRASHRVDAVIVAADWNVNLNKKWVRKVVTKKHFKGYKLTVKKPFNQHTLTERATCANSKRHIDATLVWNAKVTSRARVLPPVKSSDHLPYTNTIRVR